MDVAAPETFIFSARCSECVFETPGIVTNPRQHAADTINPNLQASARSASREFAIADDNFLPQASKQIS